jgi:hypothetical protein
VQGQSDRRITGEVEFSPLLFFPPPSRHSRDFPQLSRGRQSPERQTNDRIIKNAPAFNADAPGTKESREDLSRGENEREGAFPA